MKTPLNRSAALFVTALVLGGSAQASGGEGYAKKEQAVAYEQLDAPALVALVQEVAAAEPADRDAHSCHPGDYASYESCAPCSTEMAVEKCTKKLNTALYQDAAGWDPVGAEIARRFSADTAPYARERLLRILISSGSEPGFAVAGDLLERAPELFTSEQLVAFAESNAPAFGHELWEQVEAAPAGSTCQVLPAAFFALRGKDVGREHLLAAVQAEAAGDSEARIRRMIAALALAHLGEPQHLEQTRARMHAQTLAALDANDVELARRIALEADFFRSALQSDGYGKQRTSLVKLEERLNWHCMKRAEQVANASEVFALIEEVTPL